MMALIAAKAALGDERHLASVLENNRKGKKYLYDALKALGLDVLPSEANFVLVRIGPDAESLTKQALREKGSSCAGSADTGFREYIRVTIGTMDENRVFVEALKRLIA